MKYKSVIFDMDGVLVDSEPVILAAAMSALKEYGVTSVSEDFVPFIGTGEDRYIGGVAEKYGVKYTYEMKARTYDIYDTLLPEYLKCYDGVAECLKEIKNSNMLTALASSADRRKIYANLSAANIDTDLFDVVLSGEDVINKKPNPDIYILAGKQLGLNAEECVVIEDALNGIKAAKSAGMTAVGITTSFSTERLLDAGADMVVNELKELMIYLSDL